MPLPDGSKGWASIRSGPLAARFLPENGGRMTHLVHDRLGDILVPTAGPEFEPLNWPKAGAYPLFPYHNRLVGAAFDHEGRRYDVLPHPALGLDAQHGPAHRRPWHVVSHDADRIDLAVEYRADADWPFDFRAAQRFVLGPDRLDVELSMTNTGSGSMPGGFGWHPYFDAGPENPAFCDAYKAWPVDGAGIPSGKPPATREGGKPFPQEVFTVFLSEWQEAGVVTNGGASITITAGSELPHLVAHRTPAYICLEPVSHVAGVFGFPRRERAGAGLFVLQPSEARSARLSLHIAGNDG